MCLAVDPLSGYCVSLQPLRKEGNCDFQDTGISPKLQEAVQKAHVHPLAKRALTRSCRLVSAAAPLFNRTEMKANLSQNKAINPELQQAPQHVHAHYLADCA
jgi:hypothetical protein